MARRREVRRFGRGLSRTRPRTGYFLRAESFFNVARLAVVAAAAAAGAQFVIATHSPILLACPGARLYTLDEAGVAQCGYDDLEVVRLMRAFLEAPDRFIRATLADPEG